MMQHWHMQRRTLLGLGAAGTAVLALAGGGTAWMVEAAWRDGELLRAGRRVLVAVARAVLDGSLPEDPRAVDAAIDAHIARMQTMLRGLPLHAQAEVANLLALLALQPGRRALAGLSSDWDNASVSDVQAALHSMRRSSLLLRRQAYHALRDLTHAAFFADVSTWSLLRYPGPRPLP
jgi:hypothetical protein